MATRHKIIKNWGHNVFVLKNWWNVPERTKKLSLIFSLFDLLLEYTPLPSLLSQKREEERADNLNTRGVSKMMKNQVHFEVVQSDYLYFEIGIVVLKVMIFFFKLKIEKKSLFWNYHVSVRDEG